MNYTHEVEQMCTTAISTSKSKMKKCENGHIYDSNIYGNQCPFCPSENRNSTSNINNYNESISDGCTVIRHVAHADEVENFARTRGEWNDECDSVEPNNSSDSDWCSDFRVDEIESLAHSISLSTPPHDANIVESDSSCNVDEHWMDAFLIESVHNATKESNNSSYSYESFVPLSSLSDNTRLKKLKNEYEKTITCLTQQQEQLKELQS